MRGVRSVLGGLLTLVAIAVVIAACGSSSKSSTTSSASTSGSSSGKSFNYGYSIPTGANPWIVNIYKYAQSTAAPGGKATLADGQLSPGQTAVQVNRFITDGQKIIVVGPAQVPQSLVALLSKARSQGIKTLALEWSFTNNTSAPPTAPMQGQVIVDRAALGVDVAKRVSADAGGHAHVMYVGLPFPVNSLDWFYAHLQSSLAANGSQLTVRVNNPTDNAQGALGPVSSGLTAHRDVNAIVTYNGPSAIAAAQDVKSAGLTGKVKIYNIQLDPSTAQLTKTGEITADWDINPAQLGNSLGHLIAAAGSGAPTSQWAKTVVIQPVLYDKSNIGSWNNPYH
jgi:ABC-type sugar transport system substrate-binding protein